MLATGWQVAVMEKCGGFSFTDGLCPVYLGGAYAAQKVLSASDRPSNQPGTKHADRLAISAKAVQLMVGELGWSLRMHSISSL